MGPDIHLVPVGDLRPRKTRRPPRPVKADAETGVTIPGDCYAWVSASDRRAGHWRIVPSRVHRWRATVPSPPGGGVDGRERGHGIEHALVGAIHLITLYGTVNGFAQIAPLAVAIGVGSTVIGFSFALYAGAFAHAPVRQWIAIVAFGLVGVYGSWYTWFDDFAGEGAASTMARDAHAEFEAAVYAPLVEAARSADVAADEAEGNCADESSAGRGGRGPLARELCKVARTERAKADAAAAARDALTPYFAAEVSSMKPEAIHANDVAAAGAAGVSAPARGDYVEVAILRPVNGVAGGHPAAIVGLGLALLIDLVGGVLGSALRGSRGPGGAD